MQALISATSCRRSLTIITSQSQGTLSGIRSFFLKDENGEVLGGLLGDIWAAWLHVRTLAVAGPGRGHGFGKELMTRAELYAVERGCTDAFLDTFSFQARPFYEKLGYRVFGTLENHPARHQHYFMTKQL